MIDAVSSAGGRVTYDWTRDPGWSLGRPMTMSERESCARRDLVAVMGADIVWVMLPEAPSEGSATELGMALIMRSWGDIFGKRITIVVSGPMPASRIFPTLADHVFPGHDAALAYALTAMRTTADKH